MKRFALIAILAAGMTGCTSPDTATKALLDAGYTSVQIGGYGFLSCGKDDAFATRFTAVGPTGREVKGTVCSGVFKGNTIRLD